MAADKLNWPEKIQGKDLPDVAANKKLTFTELNEIVTKFNTHADGIDANASAIADKAEGLDVTALEGRVTINEGAITTNQLAIDLRIQISDIIDNFTSIATDKPASARLVKELNDRLGVIDVLLLSDDSNLDTVQKIVDSLKGLANDLSTLGISDVAGLTAALTAKLDASIYNAHRDNVANPHSVTATQIGLGNVDNTADANKPVSTAQATAIGDKLAKSAGVSAILKTTQAAYDLLTPDSDILYIIVD
jgi:hypothetical protein